MTPVFIWTLEPCQAALKGVELDWPEPVQGVQTLAIYLSFPGNLFCIPFADFVFNYRIIVHSVCKTNGRLTPLAASFQGLQS